MPNTLELFYEGIITSSDFIIGKYSIINEDSLITGTGKIYPKFSFLNSNSKLFYTNGLPGNKLYKLDIIRNNNLLFLNTKLGDDMNFMFKYLSNCNTSFVIDNSVYLYRVRDNSMSHTYNTSLLEIFKTLDDLIYFNNGNQYYFKIIGNLEIYNCENILKKIKFMSSDDKKIVLEKIKNRIRGIKSMSSWGRLHLIYVIYLLKFIVRIN